ncbi:MAG: hypothetical protein WCR01_08655 [Bacteroidota bacterium]
MRRLIILLTAGFLLQTAAPCQTMFKVNQYDIIYKGDFSPILTLYANHQINKRFGIMSYFYVNAAQNNSWGQGLVGPTYTPVKGITVAFLVGYQSNEVAWWRVSPIIMLSNNHWSFFGSFEYGGTRVRWDCMGFYYLDSFKFGAELIRYYELYAAGPRIEFSFLKKKNLTIWNAELWDWSYGNLMHVFGIYATFGTFNKVATLGD